MEIIENGRSGGKCAPPAKVKNIYLGIVLIISGGIWLLHNLDCLDDYVFHLVFSWPMLLVVVGGYFMALQRWVGGILVAGLGVVLWLANHFAIHLPVSKIIIPGTIIAVGIALLASRK